ncbi:MAG: hypothetical protein ACU0BK_14145 [Shimia sp.]|jgi:hypothetical protein|uniref:hypothetical protein n=1 Tax=Shimia sp. TaxID=1954381 RepID=UPI00405A305C
MVTNNKVLTVSYGTFSCTLEGFEDSFDTMKAIAEYFRDLASDDRYFGAEPPTPDAEMLARIAEREIERRVSARMDHGAIVLRATDAPEPTQAQDQDTTADDTTQKPAQDVPASEATADTVETDVVETAGLRPETDDAPAEEASDTSDAILGAAGLAAAAAVVATVATAEDESADQVEAQESADPAGDADMIEETAQEAIAEDQAGSEELDEDDIEAVSAELIEEVAEDSEDSITLDKDEDEAEDVLANLDLTATDDIDVLDLGAIEETASGDVIGDEPAAEDMSDESVAEVDDVFDMDAIVASTSDEVHVEEIAAEDVSQASPEIIEDDSVDAFSASDVLILQDSIKAAIADEDIPAADTDDAPVDVAEIEVLPPVGEADADDWSDDEDDGDADYAENSIAAKLDRIRAVVARGSHEADEDGFSEDEHARDLAAPDNSIAAAFETAADVVEDVDAEGNILDAAPEQPAEADSKPTLRARVVRMKKADFQEAVASGLLEAEPVDDEDAPDDEDDIFAEDDAAADISATADSSLTPEDEADLMAELAQVEAELKGDIAPENPVHTEEKVESVAEAQAEADVETPVLEADPEDDTSADAAHGEPDLSRLMAKANSEMKEPEGSRRRRAIAHLRAAVAATRAEKAAVGLSGTKDTTAAYRDDLASVVRAVPGGKDASQPAATKPRGAAAPLKLVAEQRIDTSEKAPEAEAETPATDQEAPAVDEKKAPRRVPVRPRRVSTDRKDREEIARTVAPVGSVAAVQGGFADYAQTVGAATMPHILEAAAAYVTFVKGQERFSRPMLMRMARDINEAEFSREEGLRSFGQLLRDQKIRKIAGGRFTADESINFKPQDRAAS